VSEAAVPELRFPEFSDGTPTVKVADLFEYKNGQGQEARIVEDGKYQLITLNSISIMGKLKDKHHTVNTADWFLEKDDLVMVLSDVAHGNFLGLVDSIPENEQYALNQRMGLLRANKEKLIVDFAKFYINSHQKYFKKHGQGSSQQNLSKGDILKFGIKLPSIPEQKKIAGFLSAVDGKLAAVEAQLAGWRDYKRGMMQALFSQTLRFKADDGSEFSDWEASEFGVVVERNPRKAPSEINFDYPCVEMDCLVSDYGKVVSVHEFGNQKSNKSFFHSGDVLFGKLRPYLRKFAQPDFEGACSTEIWVLNGKGLRNDYLFQLVQTPSFVAASNKTSGSKMPRADWGIMKDFPIRVPSPPEQQKNRRRSLGHRCQNRSSHYPPRRHPRV